MRKTIRVCDINTCGKEVNLICKTAVIHGKTYDLCDDCYAALENFIAERFDGGEETFTFTVSGCVTTDPNIVFTYSTDQDEDPFVTFITSNISDYKKD